MSKRNGTADEGFMFQIIGNNHLAGEPEGRVSFIAGTANPNLSSQNEMNDGEWIHVIFQSSIEEGKSELYINGQLNQEGSPIVPNGQITENLFIGKDLLTEDPFYTCCDGFFFDGIMDEVRIYNRILTLDEIKFLSSDVSNTTAANEVEINIYPNPAYDYFYITDESEVLKEVNLRTINGKIIFSKVKESAIKLPFLPSGIYLLELIGKDGNLIRMEKIIIKNIQRV